MIFPGPSLLRVLGEDTVYMKRITNRAEALTKQQFHEALRAWYISSTAETIGEPSTSKGRPWVIVVENDQYFHLDADTTRQAIWAYLHSVQKYGEDLAWTVRKPTRGIRVQVAFGPHQLTEREFYLAAY
jgi:hypothetical protein